MKAAVLHGPHDARYEERDDPKILESTDVILRLSASYRAMDERRAIKALLRP